MAGKVISLAETDLILLAGGRGTRLQSVVPDLPKPMAPITGKPFLQYLLQSLELQGFSRAILSVGYRADAIRSFFGARFGRIDLAYCQESEPLGTGGALRVAAAQCRSANAFAVNADTFAAIDFAAMLAAHHALAAPLSLALVSVPDTARYGAVEVEGSTIRSFHEKGPTGAGYINAGVYLARTSVFANPAPPAPFSFEEEVLRGQLHTLRPAAFFSSGYFIDIGVPQDYARAEHELPRLFPAVPA